MTSIYKISHPITLSVVYIGKTTNLDARMHAHSTNSHNKQLAKWVIDIDKNNLSPIFDIIDTCEDKESVKCEKKWIKHFSELGYDLFNATHVDDMRPSHQFNLSQAEFDSIYELADLPKQVSKGAALRQALLNHRDQIAENARLLQFIKQVTEVQYTKKY